LDIDIPPATVASSVTDKRRFLAFLRSLRAAAVSLIFTVRELPAGSE
jgi:hypothetical protein